LLAPGTSFTSYIHPESLTPYRSEMRAGGTLSKFGDVYNFDQERGAITTEKGKVVEVPNGTYDLLSLAYALRAFRIEGKNGTRAAVFYGSSAKIISFKLDKRETINVAGKQIKTVQLSLSLGEPRADALGLKLWLSDDVQRVPVRFSFNSPLGEIRAEMTNYLPK
jgi:ribosomal protein L25 (general stress protein Ctc)